MKPRHLWRGERHDIEIVIYLDKITNNNRLNQRSTIGNA